MHPNPAAHRGKTPVGVPSPTGPALAAIGVTAYLLGTIFHEALGHGLAALAVGLHPSRVSSVDLAVSFLGAPPWKVRIVAAAGCIGNLVLAALAMTAYRLAVRRGAATRFFLWLLATTSILSPGGYLMVLAIPGIGDWGDFVRGFAHPWAWKIALTILGVAISLLGLVWGSRQLATFLPPQHSFRDGFRLALIPYLAGSLIATLAGVFNPTSPLLILISAMAASFGGTAWLLWVGSIAGRRPGLAAPASPALRWERSAAWLWIGGAAAIVYVGVLGPGLPR
ncbi:MAG: hypothetical protein ACRD2H_09970 [Terriglobales bacterium]